MTRAAIVLVLLCGCRGIAPLPVPGSQAALDPLEVALGERLFFDPALSADGTVACASCHDVAGGGAESRATSVGVGGAEGRRNAPSVLSAALKVRLFWDGRAESLEEQALGPLMNPAEMAMTVARVEAVLRDRYSTDFRALGSEPELAAATRAIATYERALPPRTPVDAFLEGDAGALNQAERAGYTLFTTHCESCHDGAGIGGQRFEVLGDRRPWPAERSEDLGRMEVTGDPADRLVFLVPSLRHVGRTAPYFHDGSVATLEEAIELMGTYQLGVDLPPGEVADLAAFLRALDADPDPSLTDGV